MAKDRHTHGFEGERNKGDRMGTLWNKRNDVDGDVTIVEWFDNLGDIDKMDLLLDWIGLLEKERDLLRKKMYGDKK